MRRAVTSSLFAIALLLATSATAQTSTVMGLVAQGPTGVEGVTIELAGPVERTAVTDAAGQFRFEGLPAGMYTLTPAHAAYTFAPAALSLTLPGQTTPIFDAQPVTTTAREPEVSVLPPTLGPVYPAPFHEAAAVAYTVTQPGAVRLDVVDVLGRRVRALATGHHAAGTYTRRFEAGALPSGWYLIRLQISSGRGLTQQTHRVLLLR